LTATPTSPWALFADLLDPPENPYVRDPVGWVTSTLGEFWWSGQHRMAQSVVENRYSAFKASHDVSKSHTMSRLALWWIDVHPPGEAFVVTTAPTTPQVEAILWRYMGNAHRKADLPGRITLDAKWYIGNELVAYGRKPADYDPAAFQGIHARYVLVLSARPWTTCVSRRRPARARDRAESGAVRVGPRVRVESASCLVLMTRFCQLLEASRVRKRSRAPLDGGKKRPVSDRCRSDQPVSASGRQNRQPS
jgi:hypothetical protein